ncbi:hypothetical protein [Hymenobacter negativus]|uniref:Uncharacterized protein n=1 Tax=Hymenobacter negativus TaxID=2795026 RepID=A0ABS3QGP6_9BACT|nr:hypothetical protein [Hymenobacter negativus]MBO2010158.1 hypothetical protein [Hymenobacter negativus]
MLSAFSPSLVALVPEVVYTITTQAALRLGNLSSERASQLRVRKVLHHTTPSGGFVFDVTTLSRVQTPGQGAEQLTAELAPLLAKLVIETDAIGRLVRVLNKRALRQQWEALLPRLQATYRHHPYVPPALLEQLGQVLDEGTALEAMLASSPEYSLLFPPLYGRTFSAEIPVYGTASLPRFVGEIDLPLRTEALLGTPLLAEAAALVSVAGAVDVSHYQADEARKALCTLTDEPNLNTEVQAVHHECYTFGQQHELLEASRYTRADVLGVMSRQLTVLLHTRNH